MKITLLLPLSLLTLAGCATNKPIAEPITHEPVRTDVVAEKPALISAIEVQPAQVIRVKPPEPAKTTTVLFDFDSSQLNGENRKIISSHANFLVDNPEFRVKIEGHTDDRGTLHYNKILGVQRANVIRQELINSGVQHQQVTITSYGEEKPQLQAQNENAWAANRRAVFVYTDTLAKQQNNDTENDSSLLAESGL